MTLYLDTSAIVKLYVAEPGSADVRSALDRAEVVAASRIAYAAAAAALKAEVRVGRLQETHRQEAVAALKADWPQFTVIEITQPVVERAADLAAKHGLRGSDAVALAACLDYGQRSGRSPEFCGWDQRINAAAVATGLTLWPPPATG